MRRADRFWRVAVGLAGLVGSALATVSPAWGEEQDPHDVGIYVTISERSDSLPLTGLNAPSLTLLMVAGGAAISVGTALRLMARRADRRAEN